MILCIDTATSVCSVALCDKSGVISVKESHEDKSHSSLVTVFINDVLEGNSLKPVDLEAVAVSKGPGSYTGLRIGVSVAKGMAYAASLPLIGIATPVSMFYGIINTARKLLPDEKEILLCPMIDARRMEVYYCLLNEQGIMVKDITAETIDENSFGNIPESVFILFFGDGSYKCRNILNQKNHLFLEDYTISSAHMHIPAYLALKENKFEDVAYFEPFYLKDFITTTPKKNII